MFLFYVRGGWTWFTSDMIIILLLSVYIGAKTQDARALCHDNLLKVRPSKKCVGDGGKVLKWLRNQIAK